MSFLSFVFFIEPESSPYWYCKIMVGCDSGAALAVGETHTPELKVIPLKIGPPQLLLTTPVKTSFGKYVPTVAVTENI